MQHGTGDHDKTMSADEEYLGDGHVLRFLLKIPFLACSIHTVAFCSTGIQAYEDIAAQQQPTRDE